MTDDTRTKTQFQTENETPDTDEVDVEGHMHPELARGISAARHQDMIADADRARRTNLARGTERDGGVIDKVRRLVRRDDA